MACTLYRCTAVYSVTISRVSLRPNHPLARAASLRCCQSEADTGATSIRAQARGEGCHEQHVTENSDRDLELLGLTACTPDGGLGKSKNILSGIANKTRILAEKKQFPIWRTSWV